MSSSSKKSSASKSKTAAKASTKATNANHASAYIRAALGIPSNAYQRMSAGSLGSFGSSASPKKSASKSRVSIPADPQVLTRIWTNIAYYATMYEDQYLGQVYDALRKPMMDLGTRWFTKTKEELTAREQEVLHWFRLQLELLPSELLRQLRKSR